LLAEEDEVFAKAMSRLLDIVNAVSMPLAELSRVVEVGYGTSPTVKRYSRLQTRRTVQNVLYARSYPTANE
jgi:hypothetical protein